MRRKNVALAMGVLTAVLGPVLACGSGSGSPLAETDGAQTAGSADKPAGSASPTPTPAPPAAPTTATSADAGRPATPGPSGAPGAPPPKKGDGDDDDDFFGDDDDDDNAGGSSNRSSFDDIHCCFNGQYLRCPNSVACLGFDLDACFEACGDQIEGCFDACARKIDGAPPPKGCVANAPKPSGISCGG